MLVYQVVRLSVNIAPYPTEHCLGYTEHYPLATGLVILVGIRPPFLGCWVPNVGASPDFKTTHVGYRLYIIYNNIVLYVILCICIYNIFKIIYT